MTLKMHKNFFWCEKVKIFTYFTQSYNGRHYASRKSVSH